MSVDTHKVQLKSGNELMIWLAKFEDGYNLLQTVTREIKNIDIKEGTVEGLSMQLISSPALRETMWPCLTLCTYKGLRITKEMFEALDARKDFLEIVKEVMIYNINPFSENVASLCKAIFQKDISILG